jgi:hypothetical protein
LGKRSVGESGWNLAIGASSRLSGDQQGLWNGAKAQLGYDCPHSFRGDHFAPFSVAERQSVEADVVDVPRDAATRFRNHGHRLGCEKRLTTIARDPEPVIDIANRFLGWKRFKMA